MKAVLGNKEYFIDESQKKHYVDRGYDIRDEDNTVIAYGRGKTVPYDEYAKVVGEINELREQLSKNSMMRNESISDENNILKERVESLSDENNNIKQQMLSLTEENDDLKQQVLSLTEENGALKQQMLSLAEENDILKEQSGLSRQISADARAKSTGKGKPKEDAVAG